MVDLGVNRGQREGKRRRLASRERGGGWGGTSTTLGCRNKTGIPDGRALKHRKGSHRGLQTRNCRGYLICGAFFSGCAAARLVRVLLVTCFNRGQTFTVGKLVSCGVHWFVTDSELLHARGGGRGATPPHGGGAHTSSKSFPRAASAPAAPPPPGAQCARAPRRISCTAPPAS